MLSGKLRESLHCSPHRIHTLHGWQGVALSLQALALPPHGAKVVHSSCCCTAGVESVHIRPEHENLVRLERADVIGCHAIHVVVIGHCTLLIHPFFLRVTATPAIFLIHSPVVAKLSRAIACP